MNPLRTSHRSTLERRIGASPYFSTRRLTNAAASSPLARTCSHCWGAEISQSTRSPFASLERIFHTSRGPRFRIVSGIFSARVAVCQPSAKTVLLYVSESSVGKRDRTLGEFRLELSRMILQHLNCPSVIVAHKLTVTTAASEGRFHCILKSHSYTGAVFTDEEICPLFNFNRGFNCSETFFLAAWTKPSNL